MIATFGTWFAIGYAFAMGVGSAVVTVFLAWRLFIEWSSRS